MPWQTTCGIFVPDQRSSPEPLEWEQWLQDLDYQRTIPAAAAAATAKSLQSCPTLCDPIDSSPPGSPIPGILQARVLEWGAIAFSENYPYGVSNSDNSDKGNHLNTGPSITQPPVVPCVGHLIQTNETKIQIQSSADRITTSLSLAHQRKNKQTKTQYKSHPIQTIHKPLD